jgi:hypothetical protein
MINYMEGKMPEKDAETMKTPSGKRAKWLKAFLNIDDPTTFLHRANSARAAGYNARSNGSFSAIGSENLKLLKPHVEKWMDQAGYSETQLKLKLVQGLDAMETRMFPYQGKVVEERKVVAWSIRLGFLRLAMEAKGMLTHKHELTGKSGGPIKGETDHFVRFPSGPMTIEQWEAECEAASAAKRKRDEANNSDTDTPITDPKES